LVTEETSMSENIFCHFLCGRVNSLLLFKSRSTM